MTAGMIITVKNVTWIEVCGLAGWLATGRRVSCGQIKYDINIVGVKKTQVNIYKRSFIHAANITHISLVSTVLKLYLLLNVSNFNNLLLNASNFIITLFSII